MFSWLEVKRNVIGFEDVKYAVGNDDYYIINTLQHNQQNTLIKNTINSENEEELINQVLNDYKLPDKPFIIYGKNSCDDSVNKKYDQLIKLGFKDVYIYRGGLFEWLLLNEIFGNKEIPLNHENMNINEILKYRETSTFH